MSCAWPTTRSSRNCARCGPSLSTTASSASSHSRVSWGSTSTCDAMFRLLISSVRPLWLINPARRCGKPVPSYGMESCAHHPAHARGQPVRQGRDPPRPRGAATATSTNCAICSSRWRCRGSWRPSICAGDNRAVLATDTQKNTVYAFAKEYGVGTPEEFALRLARHFAGRRDHAGAGAGRRGRLVPAGRSRVRAVRARAADRGGDLLGRTRRGSSPGSRTWSCSRPPTRSSTASRATATRR